MRLRDGDEPGKGNSVVWSTVQLRGRLILVVSDAICILPV